MSAKDLIASIKTDIWAYYFAENEEMVSAEKIIELIELQIKNYKHEKEN